ncbi:MAG: hypothetical protein K6E19_11050, partial [Lachnospiraceae bacterium]|nr:hypothetical protein [Lachnospiraceae bacterium]
TEPEETAETAENSEDTETNETEDDEPSETEEPAESVTSEPAAPAPAPVDHDGLSAEQCERYESFIQKESGVVQLKEALSKISMDSSNGNIIIYSDDSDSSVDLARAFILELASRNQVSAGKAAKIKASTLNAKDAGNVLSTLYDCAIVIQDANELRPETMDSIYRTLNTSDKKMFVAMTVNKRSKHKFINEYGNLLEAFSVSFDIEALDNGELAEFARKYAYDREYAIDEMGLLALHTRIEERQTNSHSVMINEVKEIVDSAIVHASKKNVGHFFSVLTGKRYDSNDMIVLKEKDFTA